MGREGGGSRYVAPDVADGAAGVGHEEGAAHEVVPAQPAGAGAGGVARGQGAAALPGVRGPDGGAREQDGQPVPGVRAVPGLPAHRAAGDAAAAGRGRRCVGSRLLSAYTSAAGVKVWIITEAADDEGKRPATTVLLPEEY